jgi:AAA ATPase domain
VTAVQASTLEASMRLNPFTPGKRLTRPEIFSGRTEQLESGVNLLARASGGNVRHGLITGDRGIGKSSLASQLASIASGDESASQLVADLLEGTRFNFLVAEHVAQKGEGVGDIVAGLLTSLDRARNKRELPVTWSIEIDLKLIKGKLGQAEETRRDAVLAFVDEVEKAWQAVEGRVDGILLVIDEVDRIAEEPGVATFFKVATEVMTSRGLENIMLLPVGVVGVQELLKADHASVGRVFDVIHVPLLSTGEAGSILERALEPTPVDIKWEVAKEIARLSGGFPHPVHLLGSECFEVDMDDLIDEMDLTAATHSVVTEKWKDEFDADYVAAGYGKNREIVKVMGDYDQMNVPVKYICDRLGVEQPEISSNIGLLMKRGVIVRTDRGVYQFRDPLFRQYVKTLNIFGGEPVEQRPRKRKRDDSG